MRAALLSFLLAAVTLMLSATRAPATVGGPTFTDVLGVERTARRVWVHVRYFDAGDSFGVVGYFAYDSANAERFHEVFGMRSGEASADDSSLVLQLRALRRRLRSIEPLPYSEALPFQTRVQADTVEMPYSPGDRIVRYSVTATWLPAARISVQAYYDASVARVAHYVLPGSRATLEIVVFRGDPFEVGYETHLPVLIPANATGVIPVGKFPR